MSYSSIKIYGGSDVNYVWTKNKLTADDVEKLASAGVHSPTWDGSTIMLSTFAEGLNATDILTSAKSYVIHRQNTKEKVRYKVAETPNYITEIQDFAIGSKAEYKYFITPVYEENGLRTLGEPVSTNVLSTDFDCWHLIGLLPTSDKNIYTVDKDNIWTFELNVKNDGYSMNFETIVTDGLGRFPKSYSGERNYISGGFSCYLGTMACSEDYLDDDIEKIERWQDFCSNGELKLLKDLKGHVIPCVITSSSYQSPDDILEMPTTIDVKFTQVADIRSLSVYLA